MQIDKPEEVAFFSQPFYWKGNIYQSYTVAYAVDLLTGKLVDAGKGYAAAIKSLGPEGILDLGIPKKEPEWLLAGCACAPKGEHRSGLEVLVRVGSSSRTFLARSEKGGDSFPLSWNKTWRNENENPLGVEEQQLASVELRDKNEAFGVPACPSSRGAWPCRMKFLGSLYDEEWLAKKWPGVADDFSFEYANLAQEKQRLPGGLRGDERVELCYLNPDHPKIELTLPGKSVKLFLEKGGEWFDHVLFADTLWLFPNQGFALLLYHALEESEDEKGSNISSVRIRIFPEDKAEPPVGVAPETAPPAEAPAGDAAAIPKAKLAPKAVLVGAGAVAGVVGAAAAANAAPKQQPKAPEPAGKAPLSVEAQASQMVDESLEEFNAALVEQGLPPLSPKQVEATKAMLAGQLKEIEKIEQMEPAPEPKSVAELLTKAGIDPKQARNCELALELGFPDPSKYTDKVLWEKAVDASLRDFARLTGASDSVLKTTKIAFMCQGPGGEEVLAQLSGGPIPTLSDMLVQGGVEKSNAIRLVAALEQPISGEGFAGMKAYGAMLEKAGGFPVGSISGKLEAVNNEMLRLGLGELGVSSTPEVLAKEALVASGSVKEAALLSAVAQAAKMGGGAAGAAGAAAGAAGQAAGAAGAVAGAAGQAAGAAGQAAGAAGAVGLLDALKATAAEGAAAVTGVPLGVAGAGVVGLGALAKHAPRLKALLEKAKAAAKVATGKFAPFSLPSSKAGSPADKVDLAIFMAKGDSFVGQCFEGKDFSGMDFSGLDMKKCVMKGCNLSGASFDRADLSEADFSFSDLSKASFAEAKLEKAILCGAGAGGASFVKAKMSGLNATGLIAPDADMSESEFAGAIFDKADLRSLSASNCAGQSSSFQGCLLGESRWMRSDLSGSNFSSASCQKADFHQCLMLKCRFENADCKESTFGFGTNVSESTFFSACLEKCVWTQVDARACIFDCVKAQGGSFADSDLGSSSWQAADARKGDFSRSSLKLATMKKCNLFEASLREASAEGSNFFGASLYGADLCRTKTDILTVLDGADLTNTILTASIK